MIRPQAGRVTGVHFPLTKDQIITAYGCIRGGMVDGALHSSYCCLLLISNQASIPLREAGDHDTGTSFIALCYSSKRHDTGGLKTSMDYL